MLGLAAVVHFVSHAEQELECPDGGTVFLRIDEAVRGEHVEKILRRTRTCTERGEIPRVGSPVEPERSMQVPQATRAFLYVRFKELD